jgi:hypothetical protein
MRIVLQNSFITVIDDFLSEGQFDLLWNSFQVQEFKSVDSRGVQIHWGLDNQQVLKGPNVGMKHKLEAQYPTETPIDFLFSEILKNKQSFEVNWGRFDRDWNDLTAFMMLYRPGSGLTWHRDLKGFAGSYTFYAHPYWNVEWGGELFAIESTDYAEESGAFFHKLRSVSGASFKEASSSHLENEDANEVLMEIGHGRFVLPKPNRMVIIRGGVPHAVNKVNLNAGRSVRASVSGFVTLSP